MKLSLLAFATFCLIAACTNAPKQEENKKIEVGDLVKPKPSFELNTFFEAGDTLKLVNCSEYVYSPFGALNSKEDIKNSSLKNFTLSNRIDTMDIGAVEFQILALKSSRLILFFDHDPEASKHSYIFTGEIQDAEVNFAEGIKIGMSKQAFINTFFLNFPQKDLEKYKVISLISCVDDIEHVYTFKEETLQAVSFKTGSYWAVEY